MKIYTLILVLVVLAIVPSPRPVNASDWETYTASEYGFTMLVPSGTELKPKDWPGGWGGLYGNYEGVELYAVAKLGAPESPEEIEKFGVNVTGISGGSWAEIDKGKGNGWTWYRTVKATQGAKLAYGGYGVGPKGSYLLILVTTPADFAEHQADYEEWYHSIRLN